MSQTIHRLTFVAFLTAALLSAPVAHAVTFPGAPRCPIFPPNNPWNQRVDGLPTAADSATLIRSIGLGLPLHPGFGSRWLNGAPHGFPVNVVSSRTRRVDVRIAPAYQQASYPGPYPIPRHARVQGGRNSTGDRHLIALDRDRCLDYELLQARPSGGGRWQASAGVVFNLFANQVRPAGVTSANAAGLPILPGLARYDEVARGSINHALWFTAPRPRAAWIFPASHSDSTARDPSLPPMGLRVRLRGNVDVSHMPRQARIIAVALKRYGMILADTGMSWYFAGTPDRRWSERALRMLWRLTGRDFEVVNTGASVQQRGF